MTEQNPFQGPASDSSAAPASGWVVGSPQRVATGNGPAWILEGYRLFAQAPAQWIAIVILFMLLTTIWSFLIPLSPAFLWIGQAINLILNPLLLGGVILGFHWVAENKPLPVSTLFAGIVTRPGTLIITALILYGMFFCIAVIASQLSGFSLSQYMQLMTLQDEAALLGVIESPQFVRFFGYLMFIGIPVAMCYAFAFNQVVLGNATPVQAMLGSFWAVARNFHVFFITGLVLFMTLLVAMMVIGILLGIAGAILVLVTGGDNTNTGSSPVMTVLSMILFAPVSAVLFGINYAAFRDIFMRPAPIETQTVE